MEIDLSPRGRGSRDGKSKEEEERQDIRKGIKMCYVHLSMLLQKCTKKEDQEMQEGDTEKKMMRKEIKMYYVHVLPPHNECKHYVLQTFTNM